MHFATSVWDDPRQLQVATQGLRASGAFAKITGPLDPNGAALTPAALSALHGELRPYGSAQALVTKPLVPPAGAPVSAAAYVTYLATSRYISADGHTVQWETGLAAGNPGTTAALNAVPGMRASVAAVAHRAGADASGVAGEAPALYDVSNISDGDVVKIVPIAILAIALVLALVLRSAVAPLYLILSVVISYLASLGVSVLVFMRIGGEAGVIFLLPFLMFIFLLALGEDYNILVMTRIREEAAKDSLRRAVVRAVGATGPTVTSAGLVLAGSFVVLAVVGGSGQGNGEIRVIGFGLAVGILLDTFVVRTVLVPATVALLGRWNWWPSRPRPCWRGRCAGGRGVRRCPLARPRRPGPCPARRSRTGREGRAGAGAGRHRRPAGVTHDAPPLGARVARVGRGSARRWRRPRPGLR